MQSFAGYFDHAATSPLRASAREAMLSLGPLANPASTHRAGQRASALLEDARERIAHWTGAHPTEVVFTSGGTESINLALKGQWMQTPATRFVAAAIEHHATLDALEWLEKRGAAVGFVPCDASSVTDADAFRAAISAGDNTAATVSLANNETGVLQPIEAISNAAREAGATLHVDAVAALGHVPVDFAAIGASFLSIAAHKVGGPVGVGALLVARSASVTPLAHGGGQQRGLRSGTGDVAAAVGFAAALEEAVAELDAASSQLRGWSDRLRGTLAGLDGVRVTGSAEISMPNVVHFTVEGASAEALTFLLDERDLATSNGSACTAGVVQESHVVTAMGANGAPLRLSMGWTTTDDDVERLIAVLPETIARARRSR
ncbi:MAG: cysteine desulfurase family protein [Agrococcus casei]|uniref:cysteine desulfurase family protein n=1 Tax=Agrococcus casei TaxID=343512 RepID=UPI003F927ACD